MKKLVILAAATTLSLGGVSAAIAGAHSKSNADLARAMAEGLKGGNATLGRELGSKGNGTASAVSGDGNGGWGNLGSRNSVVGTGQVSSRGGTRGEIDQPASND